MMTPEEVFGPKAAPHVLIKDNGFDECWIWQGFYHQNGSPYHAGTSIRPVAFKYDNPEYADQIIRGLSPVCETEECVHPEHLCMNTSDVGIMLAIKRQSTQQGDCRVWQGDLDKGVTPSLTTQAYGRLSVRRFVYRMEHDTIEEGVQYTADCETGRCIKHDHIHPIRPVSMADRVEDEAGRLVHPDANHGTFTGYNTYGCHCEPCDQAGRDHRTTWKEGKQSS